MLQEKRKKDTKKERQTEKKGREEKISPMLEHEC